MSKQHLDTILKKADAQVSKAQNLVRGHDGLVVNEAQSYYIDDDVEIKTIEIPSQNPASFGGVVQFNVREKGEHYEWVLKLRVSAISGYTGGGSETVEFVPASLWFNSIEDLNQNGDVLETLGDEQLIIANMFSDADSDRKKYNTAIGRFDDASHRQLLASKVSDYLVELWSFNKQAPMVITNDNNSHILRFNLRPLADIVVAQGGSGTPAASIISASLLCRVVKNSLPNLEQAIAKIPRNIRILDKNHQPVLVQSGISSTRIVLAGLVGDYAFLFFTVRSLSPKNADLMTYTEIDSYRILDGSSENIIGRAVSDTESRLVYGRNWIDTSFFTDNAQHIYLYSFANNPSAVFKSGNYLGSRVFGGNEQLEINFTSSLISQVQIDIYAYSYSALQIHQNGIRKRAK